MLKKKLSILFVFFIFLIFAFFLEPYEKSYTVIDVLSPNTFLLDGGRVFRINEIKTFDSTFTDNNKKLANELNISEEDAFVFGNLAKQKVVNMLKGRKVYIKNDSDLIYLSYSFKDKFLYSGYCLSNGRPCNKVRFDQILVSIKRAKYKVLDMDSEKVYELEDLNVRKLDNFLVIRKSHLKKIEDVIKFKLVPKSLNLGDIKIILSDSTTQLFPTRNCTSDICKEILFNINQAKQSIDIAIYGYSSVPQLEEALKLALNRGVKVRLVYDLDKEGANIYPNTDKIVKLVKENSNDGASAEAQNIMHNKFYIFDEKVLITGSANLSHTDMSGFNSNSIVRINSQEVAEFYKKEFEQMFLGKYHNEKSSFQSPMINVSNSEIKVYFSPQDKAIENAVLPLIRVAKKYVYIPTFVLTEKRVTEELLNAKKRGVDVRIIIDALNASIKHSKHNELRLGGIEVKTENYAGKMHSKSIIVDDEYVIIGSMNFSNSAENKNDENLVVIRNPNVAKFYKNFFLYQWNRIDNKWLKNNVRAEGFDSIGSCFDGIDNNYDGLVDSEDPACKEVLH